MNQIKEIKTAEDIASIAAQAPIVIVNSFRGAWCPFCVQYLKEMNRSFSANSDVLVVGVSVYGQQVHEKLMKKLDLKFDIVSDENLVLHKDFGVTTGRGHGKEAYLQPSIFIFKNGEKVHEWIQTPKMLNFGGAISRMTVKEVVKVVNGLAS